MLWCAGNAMAAEAGRTGPAVPSLDDLLRLPAYASMQLSPNGKYIAALVPFDDRTVIALLRTADLSVERMIDPGHEAYMESIIWASDRRIYSHASFRWGERSQPYALGSLIAVDVDGRNKKLFYGDVIDPLVDDPDYVLIRTCKKELIRGCMTQVERMRNDGLRSERVLDGPIVNAAFGTDHRGEVRFSWASDDDDIQKVFLRKDGQWTLINDEAVSGVEVSPLGMSADGRAAYLLSERREGTDVVERMDVASGSRTVVAENTTLDPESVVWSFDGREPIGVRYGLEATAITFFDDAHPHAALMRDLEASFPGEQLRVVSRSRNGERAIAWVGSDRDPGRFYLLDTGSGDLRLLTPSRPWLRAESLARSRSFTIAARDGVPLQGYLTLPAKVSAPPLVVLVHGGPFWTRDEWGYDMETQILAAHGYAVLRVNFRGSSGHGRAFVESGYRRWGREMQDDVTDATRWAIREGGVSPERVCIWGSSYGGYAALMGTVREPDLYRCAVGVAGPYDLPTLFKWGDVQRSRHGEAWLKQSVGTDMAELSERSPTRHAGRIRSELLLVQGGRDYRVSPEHAKAMRRALESAGKKYQGYFPSQETHSFYNEGNRKEYYSRVLSFLGEHLGPTTTVPTPSGK
ncbi:dipeptidyl aminopeptidase/acylaminoacyl peptidase [Pseudoxanthomonas japonensis]|uniref:alpha/beta hydrolase family protein n=1 Tax=Pseudoxanthomonas japonensis TaxID=69284 RepID=UPI00285FB088|nr:alpha/beta fold hydrolase [Pseudoxanthomonas japonensis]MDR7069224.1 dipeptidyl aminopeptidase/acylaminoacyl peptidase [Pseudoxanthomonas japonensis]